MPFINWVKTPDGYKPVEITDEEMKAQNAVKKEAREKAERIREQLEIVNDKNFDRIKDSIPVPKVEPVNCKDCDDTVCCERGKDKLAYCPRCFETKEREMEFDKSRVYTALNADELRAGDKVIVADQLSVLKQRVQEGKKESAVVLQKINGEDWGRRFGFKMSDFALAYLVERKENCCNCEGCGEGVDPSDERTKIMVCSQWKPKTKKDNCTTCRGEDYCKKKYHIENGEQLICHDYAPKENCTNCNKYYTCKKYTYETPRVASMMRCTEYEPKTEQKAEKKYRPFRNTDELIKVWDAKYRYAYGLERIDRGLDMPHIWVKYKGDDTDRGRLIISYSNNGCSVIDVHELFTEISQRIDPWHYPSKGEYPTDGEETLIMFKHRGEKVFKVDKYSKQYNGWQFSPKPIAWMPLPEPPQEEV